MTARPLARMEFSLRHDGHVDIVLGFDDRDGIAARLVQEPKVAVTGRRRTKGVYRFKTVPGS